MLVITTPGEHFFDMFKWNSEAKDSQFQEHFKDMIPWVLLHVYFFQLSAPDILPQHCVIAHSEDMITVTPTVREACVYIDNQRILETTLLHHGMHINFGAHHMFRFNNPNFEQVCRFSEFYSIWTCFRHLYACSTVETFLQGFLEILKHLLQNF